jgi:hypothetical protein
MLIFFLVHLLDLGPHPVESNALLPWVRQGPGVGLEFLYQPAHC